MEIEKIKSMTLVDTINLVKKKEISPENILDSLIKNIEIDNKRNDKLNAIVYYNREKALEQIKKASKDSLLAGLPILIKNNMHLKEYPVECSSKILKGYVSPYTGGACQSLLNNGASIYGISNMDEFAMGSSNETSVNGIVRNPINREYIPGGSSGGAAAAVASGQALAALGSDTGGSIRQPAACCGVVGLKPTYGRVSRNGLVAFGSSFDQIGPITKTVKDSALMLQTIANHDEKDATSSKEIVPNYLENLENSLKNLRIGLPKEYFTKDIHPEISQEVEKVIEFYKSIGCSIKEVSLPTTKYSIAVYYILSNAEASTNLARFDSIRYGRRSKKASSLAETYLYSRNEGFGKEVKRRILMGSYVLSSGYYDAYYLKAQKAREVITNDYLNIFKECDLLLTPTTPYRIFKLGEKLTDPIAMYLSDIFTVPANVVGLPGISIPCANDSNGLPISFQLLSSPFNESLILNAGHIYQKDNPYNIVERKGE